MHVTFGQCYGIITKKNLVAYNECQKELTQLGSILSFVTIHEWVDQNKVKTYNYLIPKNTQLNRYHNIYVKYLPYLHINSKTCKISCILEGTIEKCKLLTGPRHTFAKFLKQNQAIE